LEYAKSEAAALIKDHPDVALAIADGLVERGVLTGVEVDDIIVAALARKTLKNEVARRLAWKLVEKNAAHFTVYGLES
jgi:hypothetical protein